MTTTNIQYEPKIRNIGQIWQYKSKSEIEECKAIVQGERLNKIFSLCKGREKIDTMKGLKVLEFIENNTQKRLPVAISTIQNCKVNPDQEDNVRDTRYAE
jgi:hypothetical protein